MENDPSFADHWADQRGTFYMNASNCFFWGGGVGFEISSPPLSQILPASCVITSVTQEAPCCQAVSAVYLYPIFFWGGGEGKK